MQITKHEGYYLFSNDDGEYHLSIDKYDELGHEASIDLAIDEIQKKA